MEGDDFDDLLEAKAKELRALQDKKVLVLQDEIRCRESQLTGVREQYGQLKDNFEYNLSLLEQRDIELTNYDKVISEMNAKLGSYMAEISDIKVELASSLQELKEGQAQKEELKSTYQSQLVQMEGLLEHQVKLKDREVSESLAENARVRQQLELHLSELQEEGERKRRQWERSFEQEISKITSTYNIKVSELTSKLIESDGRLKQAVCEREALYLTASELQETIDQREQHITQMEAAVSGAEWEINNYISLKHARIKELEQSITKLEEEGQNRERINSNKLSVTQSRLKERETVYTSTLMQHDNTESELRKELRQLVEELEKERCENKVRASQTEDMCSDKDNEIKRLNSKIEQLHVENLTLSERKSREEVTQKVELQQAQQCSYQLKCDLEMRKTEIEKYKAEISLFTKREDSLRSEAAQDMRLLSLRCERAESRAYGNQEEFILEINTAKEKALAEVKKLKGDVGLQEEDILTLRGELSKLYKVLEHNKINMEGREERRGEEKRILEDKSNKSTEVVLLEEQNERLREVIKHMSEDMNLISNQREKSVIQEDDVTEVLRREITVLRKQIISQENAELEQSELREELAQYKTRVAGLEKERDRLLELSNGIRAQLNTLNSSAVSRGGGTPLKDITTDLHNQRSALSIPTYRSQKASSNRSNTTSSHSVSLIHMSGDTSINEELTELCRMVDEEEKRALDDSLTPRKYSNMAVRGKEVNMVSPPKPGMGKLPTRKIVKPKPKIRNYAKI